MTDELVAEVEAALSNDKWFIPSKPSLKTVILGLCRYYRETRSRGSGEVKHGG